MRIRSISAKHSISAKKVVTVSLLAVMTVAVVACGSGGSSSSTTTTTATSGTQQPLTLKIGVGSSSTNYGPFWVAEAKNLFTKANLTVTVVNYNTSGNTANLLASGAMQLSLFTAPLGLEVAAQGKPLSIVYELSSFGASSMSVIGKPGLTSVSELKSVSGCRIATTAVGTIPYAYAARFVKAEGLTNCTLVTNATVAPLLAEVSSGSAQGGIVTYSNALSAIAAKKATLLINPLQVPATLAKKLVPAPYPAFVVMGLTSTVKANAAAVTRFVKVLREANADLLKSTPTQLGSEMATLSAFAGTTATLLTQAWKGTLPQIPTGSNAGFISTSAWKTALQGFSDWSLPNYNPTNPAIQYKTVIDMSYFNKAG